jgi:hypothetical protein
VGSITGDPHGAGEAELETTASCLTVDCSDDRLRHRLEDREGPPPGLEVAADILAATDGEFVVEVGVRNEVTRDASGEHQEFDTAVRCDIGGERLQLSSTSADETGSDGHS